MDQTRERARITQEHADKVSHCCGLPVMLRLFISKRGKKKVKVCPYFRCSKCLLVCTPIKRDDTITP